MTTEAEPIVGNWYKNLQSKQLFEVVALDEEEDTIEIQYFDGEVGELDSESWYTLELEVSEPPEDWSGPYDDLEPDDLGDSDATMHPENWANPLDELDRE